MRRLPEQSDGDQSHDRRDGKRTQWSTADAIGMTVQRWHQDDSPRRGDVPTPSATTGLVVIGETTEEHAGQEADRRRMALVVGAGKQQSYDFYQLLLRRLRIFSSIMAAVLTGVMALMLWNLYRFRDARSLEQALAACRASPGWSANDAAGWWLEDARECR
jgi:hypothetical protein